MDVEGWKDSLGIYDTQSFMYDDEDKLVVPTMPDTI